MRRVGPSIANLGYNLHDSWWGVSRFGVVLPNVTEQFDKLSKVYRAAERVLDAALVEMEPVRGELKPGIHEPRFQIQKKPVRGFTGTLAHHERRHELRLRIECDEHPLITRTRGPLG
jgi:hypothetical protein